tara:strand:+ start:2599 stop:2820 length:222 start_codon:yes stop_codon:yes gene_type:complete
MSEGFKGSVKKEDSNDNIRLKIRKKAIAQITKEYKQLKKYQKSSIYEARKLAGEETYIDKLIKEYGIDSEALM